MLDAGEASADAPIAVETTAPASPLAVAAAIVPVLTLAACGDGGGGGSTAGTPVSVAPVAAISRAQGGRMLAQATMGATSASIDTVIGQGYDGWITAQFATARAMTLWDWLVANGYDVAANINAETGYDAAIWSPLITGPDQLRQRIGFALLDLLVTPPPRSVPPIG